jgi:hypothetical protein
MATRDPKKKLKTALDILDQYTSDHSCMVFSNIYQPANKGSGIQRIVGFAQRLIAGVRLKKSEKAGIEGIKQAIDEVKRYHPIVNRSVNPEHRMLSQRALKSIQNYNQLLESSKTPSNIWIERFLRFIKKRPHSPFLDKTTIQLSSDGELPISAQRAVNSFRHTHLLKQEEDAFRMKAISLIQKKGIVFPSIETALKCIREAPIFISSSAQEPHASSMITLNQTLTPFPGETIILSGSFTRNPNSPIPTTPISESFEIAAACTHNGHPFPLQHTGWALADALIPSKPHRLEEIPLLKDLFDKKETIKDSLRHQKPLKKHAAHLIQIKQQAADKESKLFLEFHQKLCFALLSAAPPASVKADSSKSMMEFFEFIQNQHSPYTSLSYWWKEFNHRFLSVPYNTLSNVWIEQTDDALLSNDPALSLRAAQNILKKAGEQKPFAETIPPVVEHFFNCMKPILADPTHQLFLQYLSEVIEFAPPPLSEFEKKLQSLALIQLQDYITELDSELPEHPFEKIKRSLDFETDFLSRRGQSHSLVGKLELYYATRPHLIKPL